MQAYLVLETEGGEEVERIGLESQGESKNYKKFGVGKFDRKNGSSEVVVTAYYDLEQYTTLCVEHNEEV